MQLLNDSEHRNCPMPRNKSLLNSPYMHGARTTGHRGNHSLLRLFIWWEADPLGHCIWAGRIKCKMVVRVQCVHTAWCPHRHRWLGHEAYTGKRPRQAKVRGHRVRRQHWSIDPTFWWIYLLTSSLASLWPSFGRRSIHAPCTHTLALARQCPLVCILLDLCVVGHVQSVGQTIYLIIILPVHTNTNTPP